MKIAIVDYKAGNLTSVQLAFAALGVETVVTRDPAVIAAADRVVFPGVGAAKSAMTNLRELGLAAAVKAAAASGKPFLGICLGMQILFEHSEEDGGVDMLGVLKGQVKRFPDLPGCKVPEIGWNGVKSKSEKARSEGEFYFVHSYYAEVVGDTWLTANYAGVEFTAMVKRGNLWACQFHPEKSGRVGLELLKAWLEVGVDSGRSGSASGRSGSESASGRSGSGSASGRSGSESASGRSGSESASGREESSHSHSSLPLISPALTRRVIPCLDVRQGRVTKGVKFKNNIDLGDPVEMAVKYSEGGADELVFYDITASAERRPIDIGMVAAVAKAIRIPFAVGGGISNLADMERVILAGAEKISVNSLAVRNPQIIADGARAFGAQCVVLGMDPVRSANPKCPSGYEITTRGFREFTGMDAVEWAKRAADLGAGEIVVNSVDADGTREGFELEITRRIAEAVNVPVVASGGAGKPEHLVTVFEKAQADAAIIAGMIHTGDYAIADIKAVMHDAGVPTRMTW